LQCRVEGFPYVNATGAGPLDDSDLLSFLVLNKFFLKLTLIKIALLFPCLALDSNSYMLTTPGKTEGRPYEGKLFLVSPCFTEFFDI
jgi:hypothetical protein